MAEQLNSAWKPAKGDYSSGLVVFLVALPLCLGISLASGAPLFAGMITGILGGLVVSWLSGSQLSVSGPAAGLTVIVLNGIAQLQTYESFLLAVVLSGVFQIILGFLKAGIIGLYFPSSVIKGMLAAIGLILILKQIPHFAGVDTDFLGDMDFFQSDGRNTLSEIGYSLGQLRIGALLIGVLSMAVLILWEKPIIRNVSFLKMVPGALIVVLLSPVVNMLLQAYKPEWAISQEHLVSLPAINNPSDFFGELQFPNWSAITNSNVWVVGLTIAIVGSLESLLSVEAVDKLDPHKRLTPKNRELRAQGIGNVLAGLVGGLPMTAVIVRSSANINAGGETKWSSFFHGVLLLMSTLFLSKFLNLVPLSALAAVLLMVGFKLTKPALYKGQWQLGGEQFIPFIVTIVAILFTDLLKGISIGLVVGVFYILKANYRSPYFFHKEDTSTSESEVIRLQLSEHVSFLNKARIQVSLDHLPPNSSVTIDGSRSTYIDYDVLEAIQEFRTKALERNIRLTLKDIPTVGVSHGSH